MAFGQGYLLGRPSVQPLDWAAWRTSADEEAFTSGSGGRPLDALAVPAVITGALYHFVLAVEFTSDGGGVCIVPAMDDKAMLHSYLRTRRADLLAKLDGLDEYDARRPLTPTGTNLLGLVKHVASVELGYFGEVFGRPCPMELPWLDDDAEPDADMWAAAGRDPGADH